MILSNALFCDVFAFVLPYFIGLNFILMLIWSVTDVKNVFIKENNKNKIYNFAYKIFVVDIFASLCLISADYNFKPFMYLIFLIVLVEVVFIKDGILDYIKILSYSNKTVLDDKNKYSICMISFTILTFAQAISKLIIDNEIYISADNKFSDLIVIISIFVWYYILINTLLVDLVVFVIQIKKIIFESLKNDLNLKIKREDNVKNFFNIIFPRIYRNINFKLLKNNILLKIFAYPFIVILDLIINIVILIFTLVVVVLIDTRNILRNLLNKILASIKKMDEFSAKILIIKINKLSIVIVALILVCITSYSNGIVTKPAKEVVNFVSSVVVIPIIFESMKKISDDFIEKH